MVALLTPALSATASILIRRGPCVTRSAAAALRILERDRSLRGRPGGLLLMGIARTTMAFKLAEFVRNDTVSFEISLGARSWQRGWRPSHCRPGSWDCMDPRSLRSASEPGRSEAEAGPMRGEAG